MARKSRKHPAPTSAIQSSRDTVGYIRLSVRDNDSAGSIENQKLIIEKWGHQHQVPIMRLSPSRKNGHKKVIKSREEKCRNQAA